MTDTWAVHAISGDTFAYRGERVRILGIDAPGREARCPEEAALAARATERMGALLREGPFEMQAEMGATWTATAASSGE